MDKGRKLGKGVRFERIRRITGYLVGTLDRWNNAKKAEEKDRVKHGMGDEKYSVSPGLLGGILTDLGVRSIGELMEGREEETLDVN